ncbi:PREDICTED: regucalcin-like [Branchiostoma belcheri]|uniref:Regucalcin n=1 Tax=Branchiostoma belcheri TaxID=7741 RepID=A0A6P4YAI0_BRABE|nr:PREDICTED: regucalcin-like [Branchiostoma belcheri]
MSVTVAIAEPGEHTEGPHWDHRTNTLMYVDLLDQCVCRWDPVTGRKGKLKIDCSPGCVVPRASGGAVVAAGTRFAALDLQTGQLTTLAEVNRDKPTNIFNDGKCDAAGRLWAGTMGKDSVFGKFEFGAGSLFCLNADRTVTKALGGVSISNGLAWSPDNTVMYYIDSLQFSVDAFDFDLSTGTPTNRRKVFTFDPATSVPDGMTIDSDGHLWIALLHGGQVVQVDPNTGTQLRAVKFPTDRVTSCCFGGPNLDVLYVTSARVNMSAEQTLQQPLSGCVFQVTGLGAKGRPGMSYMG